MRIGFVHFSFLGPESIRAAEASECAAEQNLFWEYREVLFVGTDEDNVGDFSDENLIHMAVVIGADGDTFAACLASGRYAEIPAAQTAYGQSLGVQSTPSFVINGYAIIGAQEFSYFQQAIESLLSSSNK